MAFCESRMAFCWDSLYLHSGEQHFVVEKNKKPSSPKEQHCFFSSEALLTYTLLECQQRLNACAAWQLDPGVPVATTTVKSTNLMGCQNRSPADLMLRAVNWAPPRLQSAEGIRKCGSRNDWLDWAIGDPEQVESTYFGLKVRSVCFIAACSNMHGSNSRIEHPKHQTPG